jgi:hypothetical protein
MSIPSTVHHLQHTLYPTKCLAHLPGRPGNSHTVKAFVADLNLLAAYLPPDRTPGSASIPPT